MEFSQTFEVTIDRDECIVIDGVRHIDAVSDLASPSGQWLAMRYEFDETVVFFRGEESNDPLAVYLASISTVREPGPREYDEYCNPGSSRHPIPDCVLL